WMNWINNDIEKRIYVCYNLNPKRRWRSILVSQPGLEDGPKNPSKGTSMKFLAWASDAQLGACAGSKGWGRSAMACRR
ncbi:MAG: hypothetical protein QME46_10890, partial [Thermoanaerobacteraceae bacterium]|nr:hypothetical protein [Thermoanaerobacteraceae bacterium]